MEVDPHAFDYDYHYEKQEAAKVSKQREATNQRATEKPKSRYLAQLMKANERREVEKSAAWERMEAKSNQKDGKQGESFVTESYLKQLEIQKDGQIITAVEEEMNKKKTANAQTGMSGFHTNYLAKIKGIGQESDEKEAQIEEETQ